MVTRKERKRKVCLNKAKKEMDAFRIRGPWKSHKAIDPDEVLELAKMQCTMHEMSVLLHISEDTLRTHFSGVIEYGRTFGSKSLRRMQFEKAMEGSVPMLQWLGRFRLGQKDHENDTKGTDTEFEKMKQALKKYCEDDSPQEPVEEKDSSD